MAGLDSQSRRKKETHAVDLTIYPEEEDTTSWVPDAEECYETRMGPFAPPAGSLDRDRIHVRLTLHSVTDEIVSFAVIQQTKQGSSWVTVCAADSCHYVDVHLHEHGRSTGERLGDPRKLMDVRNQADVAAGYDLAYDTVIEQWVENLRRWRDA